MNIDSPLLNFSSKLMKLSCCRIYLHLVYTLRSFLQFDCYDHQEKQVKMLKVEKIIFKVLKIYEPKLSKTIYEDYKIILPKTIFPQLQSFLTCFSNIIVFLFI